MRATIAYRPGRDRAVNIAVVGAGIAGLGAAYLLAREHKVTLFERDERLGGHSNTVVVDIGERELGLDTGFLVHNERNYPNLIRLFRELDVATQPSEMSFSVSCQGCGLEYSGRKPFAQRSNILKPRFYAFLYDVVDFLRTAPKSLRAGDLAGRTLDQYVVARRYSRSFRNHFLVPLTAALWSTAPNLAGSFPIEHAVRFFDHHGMLGFGRFEWRTVSGGTRTYVERISERLGSAVRAGTPIRSIARGGRDATLRLDDGTSERFDAVVLAVHADDALALLERPTQVEQQVLGAFGFTRNETVLHHDERFLPTRHKARASWNYHLSSCEAAQGEPTMTYYLNRLQQLDEPRHYCVTLNRSDEIDPNSVLKTIVYEHPQYSVASLAALSRVAELQGGARTYYCGAWQGFGFHEDGFNSAIAVASSLGVEW
ncbi:MAG: NAD(P)/FAD-dependent oxidoreductase [Gaiellaceae bacterium]